MKYIYVLLLLFSLPIIAEPEVITQNDLLKNIYGNAGHIGTEFSFGINTFEYIYSRDTSYFRYLFKNNINRINIKGAITYFSTDYNRYTFLLESNIDIGSNYFKYQSFSFGIIDNLYLVDYLSADFGTTTVFEGSYKFFINLGISYYFIRTRHYYFILSDYFNILLNSVSISNTLYIKWMYIF